ncbi:MAG: hypothetical protein ACYDIE_00435 [Candidatus Krumholzibacteriia bacterium]
MIRFSPALLLAIGFAFPPAAGATSSYRDSWLSTYPDACQTLKSAATSCVLCHTSVPNLNPYGNDILGRRTTMTTTNNFDSDGDGKTNIVEINACYLPGNASSTPVPNDEQAWGLIKSLYR